MLWSVHPNVVLVLTNGFCGLFEDEDDLPLGGVHLPFLSHPRSTQLHDPLFLHCYVRREGDKVTSQ